jgi:hypothetical protein
VTTDPNHERIKTIHPAWCDPMLCTADEYQMTNEQYGARDERGRGAQHASTPVELVEQAGSAFSWQIPQALLIGGCWAWLTQGFAPWKCETYLRIGAWMGPGKEMRPLGLLSIPLQPHYRIAPSFGMSGGERLAHLIEYGFASDGYPAPGSSFAAIEPGAPDAAGS